MSKLVWDKTGERYMETGISKCVLYPITSEGTYPKGVAWNGLTSVSENPSGAEATDLYADNIKYASLRSAEKFSCSIEAYTYPVEFEACDGSAEAADGVIVGQQARQGFGLCYRTEVANDTTSDTSESYKLHLIYNASASPSDKQYQTINESPDAISFSWEIETTPVEVGEGFKPASTLVIDSRKCDKEALASLEAMLYGAEDSEATLPDPATVIGLFKTA